MLISTHVKQYTSETTRTSAHVHKSAHITATQQTHVMHRTSVSPAVLLMQCNPFCMLAWSTVEPLKPLVEPGLFQICVKTLAGKTITLEVDV